MVKIVQPLFLLGSYFGVLVYIALGEMILVVLLIAVLTPIGLQSLCKGMSMYAKESEKLQVTGINEPMIVNRQEDQEKDVFESLEEQATEENQAEIHKLTAILKRESSTCAQWSVHL